MRHLFWLAVLALMTLAPNAMAVYDTRTGRFLQRDPIGYADGMNQYRYGASNPVATTDPSGLSPELWTASGINNFDTNTGWFVDYVANALARQSDRSFVSRLGTDANYKIGGPAHDAGGTYIKGLSSERLLDAEAESLAIGRRRGAFCPDEGDEECGNDKAKHIRVLLVAPKTTTKPKVDKQCCKISIDVYYSRFDTTPNQGLRIPQGSMHYSSLAKGGRAHAIDTWRTPGYEGKGFFQHHDMGAFISSNGKLRAAHYTVRYGRYIADAKNWTDTAMKGNYDYVFVGHSQGTNILLHVLNHVCNKNGIGDNTDGRPARN